ncbi:hypothetical protein BH721_13350 [Clostridium baratii]|uniref:type II secretion system protein n=1 Tax=Clostridium baratii TaxID=1561 RepID=UPI0009A2F7F2|nr:type II secretion system protein [Clostridium baratii]OPF56638.1 hypothetical protein BH721_13350 [Clostridium baratii]OPF57898.1 hypothetical protein BH724_06540 [Clostridium baratii]OPF58516.1 hypothetical protein BH725_11685 [Clostridium baratii]
MRIVRKDKKKKGFTLIELVAVVAIIGILAAILVPKIAGYMNEAKKTKVIDQARKVLLAVETYNMKHDNKITLAESGVVTRAGEGGTTVATVVAKESVRKFIDPDAGDDEDLFEEGNALDKLPSDMALSDCKEIVENRKDFTLDESDKFDAVIEEEE